QAQPPAYPSPQAGYQGGYPYGQVPTVPQPAVANGQRFTPPGYPHQGPQYPATTYNPAGYPVR
ncbi:MAG: hypothetical protein OSB47_08225, partial [Pirellulaceae bacterium]|nr:hypothetical protein [Pirellulaceae bacterium]